MKQTAVEWLEELIECGADLEQIKKCLPKAKAKENSQRKADMLLAMKEANELRLAQEKQMDNL